MLVLPRKERVLFKILTHKRQNNGSEHKLISRSQYKDMNLECFYLQTAMTVYV